MGGGENSVHSDKIEKVHQIVLGVTKCYKHLLKKKKRTEKDVG